MTKIPKQKTPQEVSPEPEPAPIETPAAPEVQPTAASESVPEPTPELTSARTAIVPQFGDTVYVEGFGWIESQCPNHVDCTEDMYENGNKIGIMGQCRFKSGPHRQKSGRIKTDRF